MRRSHETRGMDVLTARPDKSFLPVGPAEVLRLQAFGGGEPLVRAGMRVADLHADSHVGGAGLEESALCSWPLKS